MGEWIPCPQPLPPSLGKIFLPSCSLILGWTIRMLPPTCIKMISLLTHWITGRQDVLPLLCQHIKTLNKYLFNEWVNEQILWDNNMPNSIDREGSCKPERFNDLPKKVSGKINIGPIILHHNTGLFLLMKRSWSRYSVFFDHSLSEHPPQFVGIMEDKKASSSTLKAEQSKHSLFLFLGN